MNGLFGIGIIALLVGGLFLYLGIKGDVSADTQFGTFSGSVGAVSAVLGIVLMAFGVM
jgi:hypothetical protein